MIADYILKAFQGPQGRQFMLFLSFHLLRVLRKTIFYILHANTLFSIFHSLHLRKKKQKHARNENFLIVSLQQKNKSFDALYCVFFIETPLLLFFLSIVIILLSIVIFFIHFILLYFLSIFIFSSDSFIHQL